MRFRVLGPLEVTGENGPISLGGPKQRILLAHLLIRANQVVPADELIEQVWGKDPPANPRKTLQTHVSHLRRSLGVDRLESRAPGYVLHLEPDELDATRFEELVGEAGGGNSRPSLAEGHLREALGLWRGPAFADLATEASLSGEITRLEELRVGLLEDRLAADLAERHSVSRLRSMAAIGVAAALVATSVAVVALSERGKAERQARLSRARELAAAAVAGLDQDPDRSVLLAMLAVETTRTVDGTVVPAAEGALHLAVQADRLLLTIKTGGPPVVRYSPHGTRLLTPGSDPGTADVFDAASGKLLFTLRGHGTDVLGHVNYSPNGRYISTASWSDASTEIWNARTGEMLYRLAVPSGDPVCCWEEFSPDGSVLATNVADRTVRIWDTATGRQVALIPRPGPLAFSPDGSQLWIDNCVGDWRKPTIWPNGFCVHPGARITDVSWSSDDSWIATSTTLGTVLLWDAHTGNEIMTVEPGAGQIDDIELAPGGRRLAIGFEEGTAGVWDLTTTGWHETFTLAGHVGAVRSMKFSPDGNRLATASEDATVKVWDVGSQAGGEQATQPGSGAVAYSSTGDLFAIGNEEGGVTLIDAETRSPLRTLPGDHGRVVEIGIDRAGTRIATGWSDGTVGIWDPRTGSELLALSTKAPLRAMTLSPDGRSLVTLSDDHTARVWDATTGDPIHTLARAHDAIAFSTDGKLFAAAVNKGVRSGSDWVSIWDAHTWARVLTLPDPGHVYTLVFSPDGGLLLSGGPDGAVHVLDSKTGNQVQLLMGKLGPVWDIAISPDGRRIATASEGGLLIWDASTGRRLFPLSQFAFQRRTHLAFSPDGSRLLGPVGTGTVGIYVLDIANLLDLARSRVTRGLTAQECHQYFHIEACPSSGT
jgi:WD40 repeat protein